MTISEFCFEHGIIRGITCFTKKVDVLFELWNNKTICISFFDYRTIKDMNSVDCETSQLLCRNDSPLREELLKYVLRGDGSEEEIADIKSYVFLNSWEDEILLEILASHTDITIVS